MRVAPRNTPILLIRQTFFSAYEQSTETQYSLSLSILLYSISYFLCQFYFILFFMLFYLSVFYLFILYFICNLYFIHLFVVFFFGHMVLPWPNKHNQSINLSIVTLTKIIQLLLVNSVHYLHYDHNPAGKI